MQRWNWFLAADFQGKWITTNGYAEVLENDGRFNASLRITPDTPIYHSIKACICDANRVEATVISPGREIPSFELCGYLFEKEIAGVTTRTIILTDGTTVIGLCNGPRSHQQNL